MAVKWVVDDVAGRIRCELVKISLNCNQSIENVRESQLYLSKGLVRVIPMRGAETQQSIGATSWLTALSHQRLAGGYQVAAEALSGDGLDGADLVLVSEQC